jgi:1,4-dihydroxy-2-naphthoate polyprenyltransferase
VARKSNRRTRAAQTAERGPKAKSAPRRRSTAPVAPASQLQSRGRSSLQIWLLAARPKTLPAALAPVLLGTSLAIRDGSFAFLPALAAAVCALLLQIGSNYANDYFDHRKGADTADRLGPLRATASGLISPEQMRNAAGIVLGVAALIGLYLVMVGGWPILAIGIAALLAAVAYTGGPFPYGYAGLGDLFVFLFFGLVAVNGTYYLQTGEITGLALLISICAGALVTAILVVNNIRDMETDARAGKRTLAVIFGLRSAQIEYLGLMLIAYLGVILIWQIAGGSLFLLLPIISMPLALRHIQEIWRPEIEQGDRRHLNATLAGTARLSLFFSLLLSAGLLL